MNHQKSLEYVQSLRKGTLMERLDIQYTKVSETEIWATMPVGPEVYQPMGILHGGASVALAESIASMGSHVYVKDQGKSAVGLEINANHLRSARSGLVTGRGKILHQGRKTHVWEIIIEDEAGKTISICRMTNMIIEKLGNKE